MTNTAQLPGIPQPTEDNILDVLVKLRETVEIWSGERGNVEKLDRVVTLRELVDGGVVTTSQPSNLQNPRIFIDILGPADSPSTPDLSTPPTPTGLIAGGAIQNIILAWDDPNSIHGYSNPGNTEIWRASVDDLGQAVLVGATPGAVFADDIGESSATRYYWIRLISGADVTGPYNSISGTLAVTQQNDTADIAPLAIDTALIGLLAVVEANIAELSVTNGKIGQFIRSTNYVAGVSGWNIDKSGASEFRNIIARGDVQASSLKAATLMVNSGNIFDLAVQTLKIEDNAVTVPAMVQSSVNLLVTGASWQHPLSLSITPQAPVLIIMEFDASATLPLASGNIRLRRGLTVLRVTLFGPAFNIVTIWFDSSTAAGSRTYTIDFNSVGPVDYNIHSRLLFIQGIKK